MILEEIISKTPEMVETGQEVVETSGSFWTIPILFGSLCAIHAVLLPASIATLSAISSTIATTREHFFSSKKPKEQYNQNELFSEPELSYGKRWIKNFGSYFEGMGLTRY